MANAAVSVGIAATVALLVVGALVFLAKRGYFTPDSENSDSQAERARQAEQIGAETYEIPLRKRAKTLSGPAKVFVGAVILLMLGSLAVVYDVLRTGSPIQQYLTWHVQLSAVVLIGVGAGVSLKGWFDGQFGRLFVVYEQGGTADEVEEIPYRKSHRRNTGGSPILPEVASTPLFGLFRRFRQVGEDRRLRGKQKSLDDILEHEMPNHAVEGDGVFIVPTEADGDNTLDGPAATADITYSSPNSLSRERAMDIKQRNHRLRNRLRSLQAENADLYRQIGQMRKKIENEEYADREELFEDLGEFGDILGEFAQPGPSSNGTPTGDPTEDPSEVEG